MNRSVLRSLFSCRRSVVALAIASGLATASCAARESTAPKVSQATASMDENGVIYLAVAFQGDGTIDYVRANDIRGARLLSQTRGSPMALQLHWGASKIDIVVISHGRGSDSTETELELSVPSGAATSIPVRTTTLE
jgi:hypothetical protein